MPVRLFFCVGRPSRLSPQRSYPMPSIRVLIFGISLAIAVSPATAVTIAQFNVAITENFDTLANSGTSSVMPAGWEFRETGSAADTTYAAGTGSSTTGNTFSFGGANSTDRALGSLRTGSLVSSFGTVVTNTTEVAITQLLIEYTGEQWRLGALGRADRLDFSYSLDATSVATGSWIDFDALDFIAPVTTGTVGALDGNAAGNRVLLSATITGLNLAPGASLWLRWTDFDASGADDGLAIDDFSITAVRTGGQSVPDNIPTGAMAAALAGLLVVASAIRRVAII